MKLHCGIVALSSQIGFKGTYGHAIILELQFCVFGAVLAIIMKVW